MDLQNRLESFLQLNRENASLMAALETFLATPARVVIRPTNYVDNNDERVQICREIQSIDKGQEVPIDSIIWSLFMTAPIERLRKLRDMFRNPTQGDFIHMAATTVFFYASEKAAALLKICKLKGLFSKSAGRFNKFPGCISLTI
jgi:hypothetical protein